MPNGEDRNVVRLALTCAYYRDRYGEWPSRVRLSPRIMTDIVLVLGSERFANVCRRIEVCSGFDAVEPFIRCEGPQGETLYGDGPSRHGRWRPGDPDPRDEAADWLGVW